MSSTQPMIGRKRPYSEMETSNTAVSDGNESDTTPYDREPRRSTRAHRPSQKFQGDLDAKYETGDVVWARLEEFPWWPGRVEFDPDVEDAGYPYAVPVRWFGVDSDQLHQITRDRLGLWSLKLKARLEREVEVNEPDREEYEGCVMEAQVEHDKLQKLKASGQRYAKAAGDRESSEEYQAPQGGRAAATRKRKKPAYDSEYSEEDAYDSDFEPTSRRKKPATRKTRRASTGGNLKQKPVQRTRRQHAPSQRANKRQRKNADQFGAPSILGKRTSLNSSKQKSNGDVTMDQAAAVTVPVAPPPPAQPVNMTLDEFVGQRGNLRTMNKLLSKAVPSSTKPNVSPEIAQLLTAVEAEIGQTHSDATIATDADVPPTEDTTDPEATLQRVKGLDSFKHHVLAQNYNDMPEPSSPVQSTVKDHGSLTRTHSSSSSTSYHSTPTHPHHHPHAQQPHHPGYGAPPHQAPHQAPYYPDYWGGYYGYAPPHGYAPHYQPYYPPYGQPPPVSAPNPNGQPSQSSTPSHDSSQGGAPPPHQNPHQPYPYYPQYPQYGAPPHASHPGQHPGAHPHPHGAPPPHRGAPHPGAPHPGAPRPHYPHHGIPPPQPQGSSSSDTPAAAPASSTTPHMNGGSRANSSSAPTSAPASVPASGSTPGSAPEAPTPGGPPPLVPTTPSTPTRQISAPHHTPVSAAPKTAAATPPAGHSPNPAARWATAPKIHTFRSRRGGFFGGRKPSTPAQKEELSNVTSNSEPMQSAAQKLQPNNLTPDQRQDSYPGSHQPHMAIPAISDHVTTGGVENGIDTVSRVALTQVTNDALQQSNESENQ